jgi:hypothetical protein
MRLPLPNTLKIDTDDKYPYRNDVINTFIEINDPISWGAEMKIKSLVLVSYLLIFISSCAPKESNLFDSSQTLEGITISIEDVDLTPENTTITLQVTLGERWDFNLNSDVQKYPDIRIMEIFVSDNQNNRYSATIPLYTISQEDLEFTGNLDPSTGEIKYKRIIEIYSLPPDIKYLAIQLSLLIEGIQSENTISFDLQQRGINEEWSLDEEIIFAGFPLQLEKASITEGKQYMSVSSPGESQVFITHNIKQLEIFGTTKTSPVFEIVALSPIIDESNVIISDLPNKHGRSGSSTFGHEYLSTAIPLIIKIDGDPIYILKDSITLGFEGHMRVNKIWQIGWVFDEQP